jgi:adenylate kinase family enzyme
MKLHIIGGSGSGKSYLSALLSRKLNIPHYELDDIFWDNEADVYGVKAPEEERDLKLKEIVSRESWIIEGVYRAWVGPSLLAADKVIVLMTPLSVQEERICKRHEERVSGAAVSNKRETIESVRELIEWNRDYNLVKLPRFIESCEYKDKLITVNNNLDILELLAVQTE